MALTERKVKDTLQFGKVTASERLKAEVIIVYCKMLKRVFRDCFQSFLKVEAIIELILVRTWDFLYFSFGSLTLVQIVHELIRLMVVQLISL